MNTKFAFKGNGEIVHLNTRKEGAEDDVKELAIDVKLRIKSDKYVLDSFQASELKDALWNDIGAVNNLYIDPISMSYTLKDYRIELASEQFFDVTLKKFTFQPKDGNDVVMTFTASFSPTSTEVARLAEYLQDEVSLTIEPSNEELDLSESK